MPWTCSLCTYNNPNDDFLTCEMCNCTRPINKEANILDSPSVIDTELVAEDEPISTSSILDQGMNILNSAYDEDATSLIPSEYYDQALATVTAATTPSSMPPPGFGFKDRIDGTTGTAATTPSSMPPPGFGFGSNDDQTESAAIARTANRSGTVVKGRVIPATIRAPEGFRVSQPERPPPSYHEAVSNLSPSNQPRLSESKPSFIAPSTSVPFSAVDTSTSTVKVKPVKVTQQVTAYRRDAVHLVKPLLVERFTSKLNRDQTNKGGNIKVIEKYFRADIKCCISSFKPDAKYILVPMASSLDVYMDLFEQHSDVTDNVLILSSVVNRLQSESMYHTINRLKKLLSNIHKSSGFFANENCLSIHQNNFDCNTPFTKSMVIRTIRWIRLHIDACIAASPIRQTKPLLLILSQNEEFVRSVTAEGFLAMECYQFITKFCPENKYFKACNALKSLRHIAESIYHLHSEELEVQSQQEPTGKAVGDSANKRLDHWGEDRMQRALREKLVYSGKFEVSSYSQDECFLKDVLINDMPTSILVAGAACINGAIHGDKVVVELLPTEKWKQPRGKMQLVYESPSQDASFRVKSASKLPTGRVVGVLKRVARLYVVTLSEADYEKLLSLEGKDVSSKLKRYSVVPMDARIPKIRIATALGQMLLGMRFVVSIDEWPTHSRYPLGHYVRTIGPIGDLNAESAAILLETQLEHHQLAFPKAAIDCLPSLGKHFCIPETEIERRRDLRHSHHVFSVDPPGCQDIDDTMSFRELDNGLIEIGVHIANVTHFVKQNSALDREAQQRGTSVYLNNKRLDMLPSLLSEDLCSLRSGIDRLAVSVIWTLTASPEFRLLPERTWFGETVIRSRYSLTYAQAQRIIDGHSPGLDHIAGSHTGKAVDNSDVSAWLKTALTNLMLFGKHRREIRMQNHAIDLKSSEVKFKLNAAEQPENIEEKQPLQVHSTIEELMVFANESVAKQIHSVFPTCALLRKHEAPEPVKLANLVRFCHQCDITVDQSDTYSLLQSISKNINLDKSLIPLLDLLITRSMSEARYFSTGNLQMNKDFRHFGLALDFYTHFTSPIRRYADVIVHRLLLASINVDQRRMNDKYILDIYGVEGSEQFTIEQVKISEPAVAKESVNVLLEDLNELEGEKKYNVWGKSSMVKKGIFEFQSKENIQKQSITDDFFDKQVDELLNLNIEKNHLDYATTLAKPDAFQVVGREFNLHTFGIHSVDVSFPLENKLELDQQKFFTSPLEEKEENDDEEEDIILMEQKEKPESVQQGTSDETLFVLDQLCDHINNQHRRAKQASFRSNELFFALYFSEFPELVECVVISLRTNGFICFVPKYQLKLPCYIVDKDRMMILSCENTDASNPVVINDCELHYQEVEDKLTIQSELHGISLQLQVFDKLTVKLSCPFEKHFARIPKLRAAIHFIRKDHSHLIPAPVLSGHRKRGTPNQVKDQVTRVVVASDSSQLIEQKVDMEFHPSSFYRVVYLHQYQEQEALDRKIKCLSGNSKVSCNGGRLNFNNFQSPTLAVSPLPELASSYPEDDSTQDAATSGFVPSQSFTSVSSAYEERQMVKQLTVDATRRIERLKASKRDAKVKKRLKNK